MGVFSNYRPQLNMLIAPLIAALMLAGPFLASPLPAEEQGALMEEDRFSGALIGSLLLQILVNIIKAQIQEILGISTTTKPTPILDFIGGGLFPAGETTTTDSSASTTTTTSAAPPTTTTTTPEPTTTTTTEQPTTTTTATTEKPSTTRCGGLFGGGLLC